MTSLNCLFAGHSYTVAVTSTGEIDRRPCVRCGKTQQPPKGRPTSPRRWVPRDTYPPCRPGGLYAAIGDGGGCGGGGSGDGGSYPTLGRGSASRSAGAGSGGPVTRARKT